MKAFGREIRKVLRVRRDWLREQRKEVNKRRFLIVKNDKNLSDKERAELEDLLQKHPQFLQYVTLLSDVRSAIKSERDEGIRKLEEIEVNEGWGSTLQAAVGTIKRNAEKLLNYRTVKHPEARVRVNPECMMRSFRVKTKNRNGVKTEEGWKTIIEAETKVPLTIKTKKPQQAR